MSAQAKLRVVVDNKPYPVIKDTVRPYRLRLHHGKQNEDMAHRCYSDARRAVNAAFVLTKEQHIGDSIEVYDVSVGKHLATFTNRIGKDGRGSVEVWVRRDAR